MNRPFKFKAWDLDREVMISWEHLIGYCDIDYLFGTHTAYRPNVIVKQYTGMPDVDGSEIYEGAILRCANNHLWVVSFVDGCFIAHAPNCMSEFVYLYDYDFTVVGDVHETPELLKEKR